MHTHWLKTDKLTWICMAATVLLSPACTPGQLEGSADVGAEASVGGDACSGDSCAGSFGCGVDEVYDAEAERCAPDCRSGGGSCPADQPACDERTGLCEPRDIDDPCATVVCGEHSACVNDAGVTMCQCHTGYCGSECDLFCGPNEVCGPSNTCDCPGVRCGDACCANSEVCHNSECCASDCTDPDPPIVVNFFFGHFLLYEQFLSEVADHSNVVLGPGTPTFIQAAKARGMKPIVWISRAYYPWDVNASRGGLDLRSDYQTTWNAYAAQIAPYIDDIYGFFPHDEPFWAAKLSAADQNALNVAIKTTFPDKPIMTTFARPTIDASSFIVPHTYDIVSYDNYYGASWESDRNHYEVLKSKLSPGQSMFLIGDAFAGGHSASATAQQLKADKIYQAYQLATTPGEPIVGILNFVWDGYPDNYPANYPERVGPLNLGLREMPIALPHFKSVGQTAIANQ